MGMTGPVLGSGTGTGLGGVRLGGCMWAWGSPMSVSRIRSAGRAGEGDHRQRHRDQLLDAGEQSEGRADALKGRERLAVGGLAVPDRRGLLGDDPRLLAHAVLDALGSSSRSSRGP